MLNVKEQEHLVELAEKWVKAEVRRAQTKASAMPRISPKTAEQTAQTARSGFVEALKEVG